MDLAVLVAVVLVLAVPAQVVLLQLLRQAVPLLREVPAQVALVVLRARLPLPLPLRR